MRSIVAIARKDLMILVRVRAGLFFTFVWPIVVAVLFGFVFSGQSQGRAALRVVAVDDDNSDGSREFLARLEQSGEFQVDRAPRAEAENLVRLGQRGAFLVIKPGFGAGSQRMFYGEPRQVEIGIDPARQAEAAMIEGLLMKYAMADMQRLFSEPDRSRKMIGDTLGDLKRVPPDASGQMAPLQRFLGELDTFLGTPLAATPGNQSPSNWEPLHITKTSVARERRGPSNGFEITFAQGVVWGIIGCVMTFAVSLVSERVRGTFVRLQMAPLTRGHVLAGKGLACFTAISLVQIMLFTIGGFFFNVRPSSLGLLVLICLSASLCFVGFMMMISSFGKNEQAVSGAGWAMLMPMTMFGGGMIPQFAMPPWMLTVGSASPVKWAILGLEGAIWRNFTLTEMLGPCAILLAFGAVCFTIGLRGLRD